MMLNRIPKGEIVLIDANIFIYAIRGVSKQCMKLLNRCAAGEILGVITSHLLAEVMHRLMIAEAIENEWISGSNPAKKLAEKPGRIKILYRYKQAINSILAIGVRFETLEKLDFIVGMRIQQETGLLTNDALLIAVGERLRIHTIASADNNFSKVHKINLYSPNDLIEK